jgi:P-type Cu+ transporter
MASGHSHDGHHQDHDHASEFRVLVASTVVVGLLLGFDLALGFAGLDAYRRPLGVSLSLIAAIIGGGRVVYLALSALLEGKIGADIALAVACIAAGLMGEYFVAAEVVFIALVGECLEAFTFERAHRSIQGLLEYRPRTARIIRDEQEVEIAADTLRVGDRIVVRPGERIAADGVVVAGRSAVDQAILTGEGLPVDKGEGDPVLTGTVNQFGRLEVEARKVGTETTLGQVIRLLDGAQRNKSPLERTADRYARMFLPAVLTASAIVFLGTNAVRLWGWYRLGVTPTIDLMPTLAVLVVACPCSLVLATPAAVLAATARLARRGVLVKGGAALEQLARVDALAFDKTGTLTEGRPEVGDVLAFHGTSIEHVLWLAGSAEQASEHPLARLVVAEARSIGLTLSSVDDFEAQPGAGVQATIRDGEGRRVLVGNLRLIREHGLEVSAEVESALKGLDDSGQTTLLVAEGGRVVGALGARDQVRAEAHDVIHDLKHLGLKDLTILTGDREAPARSVAKKVHIKQVEAGLTPTGKADWVASRKAEGRVVAMIGDGVNDAPALATADVGLALGGVGADIAAEAGSIVLMGDPLEPLPEAIRLARQTVRVIRQNILIFAFGLNGLAVVLAGLRVLGPVAAAITHQVGSLLVLLNAIRLLGFESWGRLAVIRGLGHVVTYCRSCRPSTGFDWAWNHRRGMVRGLVLASILAYSASGITLIGPGELGLLQRFGRLVPTPLGPGLHVRWPEPVERVTKVEPDTVRVVRVGPSPLPDQQGPVAWNAVHGAVRDESALFFTGDENMVELAGVVEYRLTEAGAVRLVFGVASVDASVAASAEGAFREAVGRTSLEDILAEGRRGFEAEIEATLRQRLAATGLEVALDKVRVTDAHPPREVVPDYRDVSAAVSDVARYRNEAEAYAAERRWSGRAEARARLDGASARGHSLTTRAEGDRRAFLARAQAHASRPDLDTSRLTLDTLAAAYASRPKLIIDPKAAGRRHLWIGGFEGLGPARLEPIPSPSPRPGEPED